MIRDSLKSSAFRTLALAAAVVMVTLLAPQARADAGLARKLERLVTKLPHSKASCGALLVDLQTGQTVVAVDHDAAMVPASNAKLFSLAAAIDVLGSDFVFRTRLVARGDDLVVVGDGDPAFGDPELANGRPVVSAFAPWADAIEVAGLSQIEGDLIIDDSVFEPPGVHPNWSNEDIGRRYAAPVGGLNFHENCVAFRVFPANDRGDLVRWAVEPPTTLVRVVNRCKSGSKGRNNPAVYRPEPDFEYVLTGWCTKPSSLAPLAVPDPALFFGDALRQYLATRGIGVAGSVRRERIRTAGGSLPPGCRVIAVHETPIAHVAARVGKDSQNLFAEALLKRAGYELAKRQGVTPVGSWDTGRQAVRQLLRKAGIEPAGVVIDDASGLSRSNRASASDFVQLLTYMHRHRDWKLFAASLAIGGRDGKLRRRMDDVPGLVCAKTGYMRGVRTLSGYVETPDRRMYAFSVLFNGFRGPSTPYKRIQDEFCRLVAASGS